MPFFNSILTFLCFVLASVVISESASINGGESTNLISLGTVDGKTYFADATKRNWTAARTFCSEVGMRLATITSEAQLEFLRFAYDSTNFAEDHWTAARDSQEARQFTWDSLNEQPSETFNHWINWHNLPYQTCALYNFIPGVSCCMHFENCAAMEKVLCETIPLKTVLNPIT
ncbi:Early activation antigen CD69 [Orchesella cincta]|uniref:Early activation antigen CD69 n=1 Tax=Orchesella cincta TaxID=48709 RepID=A0A1D2N9U0_ORCCI|nr:Early activation antigen CD69 [Orchesella cincta]